MSVVVINGASIGSLTFQYDSSGNVVEKGSSLAETVLPQAVVAATYDAANELTSWGPLTFSYDLNGNRTSDGLTTFVWNGRNRLSAITGASTGSFSYDALGRRASRTSSGHSSTYVYDGETVAREDRSSNAQYYLTGPDPDEVFVVSGSAGTFSRIEDRSNSSLAWIDSGGNATGHLRYEPYGRPDQSAAATVPALAYAGRELDEQTLYYNRARYYDAQVGRFISSDPIGLAGGFNAYLYANANPVMYRDPTGLDAWLSIQAEVLSHFGLVGVGGGGGAVFNVGTWETCLYTMFCLRPGFGMIISGGLKVNGSIFGPHCGKDLQGRSVTAALDLTSPAGGLSASAGKNNGAGVGVGVGPSVGAGFSVGIEICQMQIQKCWNTPDECKGCKK